MYINFDKALFQISQHLPNLTNSNISVFLNVVNKEYYSLSDSVSKDV